MNEINLDEISAKSVEEKYVHEVYNEIFKHFDKTRYRCWPSVLSFLSELNAGDILVDVGCGNGKYFHETDHFLHIGCDFNCNLLEICRSKGMDVFQCDCQSIPIRNNIADACICIAVIHHLANEQRRLNAIKEIVRILSVGGKALIYVWARNQRNTKYLSKKKCKLFGNNHETEIKHNVIIAIHENRTEFQKNDVLVPWTRKDGENNPKKFFRYYHVFEMDELKHLCEKICNIKILKNYYDEGNCCVIFQKLY